MPAHLKPDTTPTTAELFCGPGGFAAGAAKAGWETLWAIDIDPETCSTYRQNSPHVKLIEGDIREIGFEAMETPDCLTMGFPCNEFSRMNMVTSTSIDPDAIDTGKYAPLYRECSRAIETLKPAMFIAENVPGLLVGGVLGMICEEWERLGYRIRWDILNAADYGVPQNRRRIIIAGIRHGTGMVWQPPAPALNLLNRISAAEAIQNPPAANHDIRPLTESELGVVPHMFAGEDERQARIPAEELEKLKCFHGNLRRKIGWDRPAPTVVSRGGLLFHPSENRRLTMRELAMLQSFPDHWEFHGGVTSVQRQIAMAVPPLLAEALFRQAERILRDEPAGQQHTLFEVTASARLP